jgi:hypothetical protein
MIHVPLGTSQEEKLAAVEADGIAFSPSMTAR